MSTEILTRNMDFIHSISDGINVLRMDTTYPVRLSGCVLKIFKATSNFTKKNILNEDFLDEDILFSIRNSVDEVICEIKKKNIFDFSGDNIIEKAYTNGDYVMVIIDITSQKIFVNSLHNARDISNYNRVITYKCNGVNDNTILEELINIITDVYNNTSESYDIRKDEYDYKMSNTLRQNTLRNAKYTIKVTGSFGIDYSTNKFTYGGFNRQNRSSIMTIGNYENPSTTKPISSKNLEVEVDFSECYISEIKFNNNKVLAALYNTKRTRTSISDPIVYYNVFTGEDTPHLVDSDGVPYGDLFPRRLVFISVEGSLPMDVTIKSLYLTTFGTGVYCETDSDKNVNLVDCKININNNVTRGRAPFILPEADYGKDASNLAGFYNRYRELIPFGVAVDVNCFECNFYIDNTLIRNDSGCYSGDLIINSSKNMRITNSDVLGFSQFDDSYKNAYQYQYLDYDYNPDCYYEIVPALNEVVLSEVQKVDINFIEILIIRQLFNMVYLDASKRVININSLNTSTADIDTVFSRLTALDLSTSKSDLYAGSLVEINSGGASLEFDYIVLKSALINYDDNSIDVKGAEDNLQHLSLTSGVIKNVPIAYKSVVSSIYNRLKYGTTHYVEDVNPSNMLFEGHYNLESKLQPNIIISSSTLKSDGVIYQAGGSVILDGCNIDCSMYDYHYRHDQINVISGSVSVNNCKVIYDTVGCFDGVNDINWIGSGEMPNTIYKIAQANSENVLKIMTKLKLNSYTALSSLFDYYYFIFGSACRVYNKPIININGTDTTMYVDSRINTPSPELIGTGSVMFNKSNKRGLKFVKCNDDVNHNYNGNRLAFMYSGTTATSDKNLFNPLTDGVINVTGSNFYVDNSFGRESYKDLGSSGLDMGSDSPYNNECVSIIYKVGSWVKDQVNLATIGTGVGDKIFSGIFQDLYVDVDGVIQFNNICDNYINVTVSEYIESISYNQDRSYGRQLIRQLNYADITTGTLYYIKCIVNSDDENVYKDQLSLNKTIEATDNYGKLIDCGIDQDYTFYDKLAKMFTKYNDYKIDSNGKIYFTVGANDFYIENELHKHVITTKLYPADLPQTGYFYDMSMIEHLRAYTDIIPSKNRTYRHGVTGFVLSNVTLNMENCNIGISDINGRHTYNSETILKKAPRVCFELYNNGIYNIRSTNAIAWGSVIVSTLASEFSNQLDSTSVAFKQNFLNNFDKTTLELYKGQLNISDCNFMNYNAVRFLYDNSDKLNEIYKCGKKNMLAIYKDPSSPANTIDDIITYFNSSGEVNDITYNKSKAGNYKYQFYTEAIINANELPIMWLANKGITNISNTTIKGNETLVLCGNVYYNNCDITNISNGLILHVMGMQYIPSNTNRRSATKVSIRNSRISSTKDLINDKYINASRKKTYVNNANGCFEQIFYDDDTNTGYKNIDNTVSMIYVEGDSSIELDSNDIIFKTNTYESKYGLKDNTKVRLINHIYTGNDIATIDVKDNNIVTLFDGFTINSTNKTLPTSRGYSLIESKKANVFVNDNTIDIVTVLNNQTNYAIKFKEVKDSNPCDIKMSNALSKVTDNGILQVPLHKNSITKSNEFINVTKEYKSIKTKIVNATSTESTISLENPYQYKNDDGIKIDLIGNSFGYKEVSYIVSSSTGTGYVEETTYAKFTNMTGLLYTYSIIRVEYEFEYIDASTDALTYKSFSKIDSSGLVTSDLNPDADVYHITSFNTPVVYSTEPISIDVSGNTINNGNPSITPENDINFSNLRNNIITIQSEAKYKLNDYIYLNKAFNTIYTEATGGVSTDFDNGTYKIVEVSDTRYGVYQGEDYIGLGAGWIDKVEVDCMKLLTLNSSTVIDMTYDDISKPTLIPEPANLNSSRMVLNKFYYTKPNITLKNNKLYGLRSQAFYTIPDVSNVFIVSDNGISNHYLYFKKINDVILATNKISNTSNSTEQKYYKTFTNFGLFDQLDNAYTYTNSYGIKLDCVYRSKYIHVSDFPNITTLPEVGFGSLYVYPTVYTPNSNTPREGFQITDILTSTGKSINELEFALASTSPDINGRYLIDYKIRGSSDPTVNLGNVAPESLVVAIVRNIDPDYTILLDFINGNIVSRTEAVDIESEYFISSSNVTNYQSVYTPDMSILGISTPVLVCKDNGFLNNNKFRVNTNNVQYNKNHSCKSNLKKYNDIIKNK